MGWFLLIAVVLALLTALAALTARRAELRASRDALAERARARERGSHEARLQYPVPDLARCIGCGTCVAACPEAGVLDVVHGQAIVVHGARCVGHGRCAAECPVGAIALTLGDLSQRNDLPALTPSFEAVGTPGLFLAGEVTGYALIRTAITHGTEVAREVARRSAGAEPGSDPGVYDLVIVGAGPAGLACALEAKRLGLTSVIVEQEQLGGSVARYPRRKLVMTQPVELPLHGKLTRTSYTKEELMELWERIAREQELRMVTGCEFQGTEPVPDGGFVARTSSGSLRARHVCLALGRRGTPRKLGVPGEESPHVAYSLMDARSYTERRVLIVGGGDSAVEAALGLAEQPGNRVALSYRRKAFTRLKARNEERIQHALESGAVTGLFESEVRRIEPGHVDLELRRDGGSTHDDLAIDDVFVFAGGMPPYPLLESCGVSFDPADHPEPEAAGEGGRDLWRALLAASLLALAVLAWAVTFRGYYGLEPAARLDSRWHELLRPGSGVGLAFGVLGAALLLANLLYLPRRSARVPFQWGSLQRWMSAHVLTGILALLAVLAHSALSPGHTVGGHALAGLALLVTTGAIGRYLYSFVPRAANGRELDLDEVRARLAHQSAAWDRGQRAFAERARDAIDELVRSGQWESSFLGRVGRLLRGQRRLRAVLAHLEREARAEGLDEGHVHEVLQLARDAHRDALAAAHLEDLRGLLSTWRYLHRWVALLMVALVVMHVVMAVRYGAVLGGGR